MQQTYYDILEVPPTATLAEIKRSYHRLARLHHPYDFTAYTIIAHVIVRSNLGLTQELSDGSKLFKVLNSMLLVGS